MAKYKNLQPWMDYFGLLESYVRNGYLEVNPTTGEAYITYTAIYTLGNFDRFAPKWLSAPLNLKMMQLCWDAVKDATFNISTYADYLNICDQAYARYSLGNEQAPDDVITSENLAQTSDKEIMARAKKIVKDVQKRKKVFALHVVGDEQPHDVVYTILLERKKDWLGKQKRKYEIIFYK